MVGEAFGAFRLGRARGVPMALVCLEVDAGDAARLAVVAELAFWVAMDFGRRPPIALLAVTGCSRSGAGAAGGKRCGHVPGRARVSQAVTVSTA